MVGAIAPNLHEGSRSEYLAQYVLASFGTAVAVPHHEDSGVDLFCTLTERIGNRAWPRSHYTVQVKSTLDPWVFEGEESVRWLVEHPLPLLLCVVDKSTARIRIWHTSPRFYVWSLPPRTARVELIPKTEGEGRCTMWQGGNIFSLDAPIVDFTIPELLGDGFYTNIKKVLDFWLEFDIANLHRIHNGIHNFTMPDWYETNTVKYRALASQGITRADDISRARDSLRELVLWLSEQLYRKEDITGATLGSMLWRHLFREDSTRSEARLPDAHLLTKINRQLGSESYLFAGVDLLVQDVAAKLASTDQTSLAE